MAVHPKKLSGPPTFGGGVKPETLETIKEIKRPIIIKPGRPIAKGRISRFTGFSSFSAEKPFLSDMRYHKRARDGIV